MEFKDRYMVTISNTMDATGKFEAKVNCPFEAKYCFVRVVAYDGAHDIVIVRATFVQGNILTCFADDTRFSPNTMLRISSLVRGTFTFECVDADLDPKGNMLNGELAIMLEFTS